MSPAWCRYSASHLTLWSTCPGCQPGCCLSPRHPQRSTCDPSRRTQRCPAPQTGKYAQVCSLVALLDMQHMCSKPVANKPNTKGLIVDCGTHRHIITLLALLQAGLWTMHTAFKHIMIIGQRSHFVGVSPAHSRCYACVCTASASRLIAQDSCRCADSPVTTHDVCRGLLQPSGMSDGWSIP